MLTKLLLLSSLPSVVASESVCTVPLSTRSSNLQAVLSTTVGSHTSIQGSLTFAPVGTISNHSGTYGAHVFPDHLDASTCDCLEGTTCTYKGPPHKFSNPDVSRALAPRPTRPSLLSPWSRSAACPLRKCSTLPTRQTSSRLTPARMRVLFPEISPLPTINQLTMEARPGTLYVIVTTGDKDLADKITQALVNAGAPEEMRTAVPRLIHYPLTRPLPHLLPLPLLWLCK